MSSQAFVHKTLILHCRIESDSIKKSKVTVKNASVDDWDKNLQVLISNILKKFKFLKNINDSEWCISINSQIINKQDSQRFGSILSTIPPGKAIVDIIRNIHPTSQINQFIATINFNNQKFNYKFDGDKDDWTEDTYANVINSISEQFNLYSQQIELYEDVDGDLCDIDDIQDIIDAFDDENGKMSIRLVVKVKDNGNQPIIEPKYPVPINNNNNQNIIYNHPPQNQYKKQPQYNNNNNNAINQYDPQNNVYYHQQQQPQQQQPQQQQPQQQQQQQAAMQFNNYQQQNQQQNPIPMGYNNNYQQPPVSQQPSTHHNEYKKQPIHKPMNIYNEYPNNDQPSGFSGYKKHNTMDIRKWLSINQLHDLQDVASSMSLDVLLSESSQNIRASLNAMGLGSQQISRLIAALNKHKQSISSPKKHKKYPKPKFKAPFDYTGDVPIINTQELKIENISDNDQDYHLDFDSDVSIDDVKDDGKHPVWPLIIPNNCSYNAHTGRMTVDHSKQRHKLIAYKPALEFIRKINQKIATISIVGRARTGKSLVAGELYAPGKIPCPFDLGHKMDACTYGIWVSAKTIKHPHKKDTVVLIFDVEGTGFHQATKHNDMQLMVVALLISSYFIYNSKGTFDAPALDEIKFVLELTENIQTAPNDRKKDGTDFKKFFPIFMWLLRDAHLEPVINNKRVSVRQYFTQKVLSSESGFSQQVMQRQFIRQAFIQTFAAYDAYSLPMPHSNNNVLKKLGAVSRQKLQPEFNKELDKFCDKVFEDTKCKVLFSKDDNGEDQYVHCTGTHLAGWIEQCIESANSDKIPEVSSMTDAVMADVFRETKKKAIKQYKKLLDKGLGELRNNNDQQPLDEFDIVQLHGTVWNKVLNQSGRGLQPMVRVINNYYQEDESDDDSDIDDEKDEEKEQKNEIICNEKPQIKVFKELCDEIGHHAKVSRIGQRGVMNRILTANRTLSTTFCKQFLAEYFNENIEPMLEEPKQHEGKDLLTKFTELKNIYFKQCKGPSKDICWKEFESKTKRESLQNFNRIKVISQELLKAERDAAKRDEAIRKRDEALENMKKEWALQQQATKQEITRIKKKRESDVAERETKLKEAEKRMQDMKNSQLTQLAETFKKSNEELKKKLIESEKKNKEEMKKMMEEFNKKMEQAAKQPSATVINGGFGFHPYGPYYGYNGMLPYSLILSKPYTSTSYPTMVNTFDALITDDATMSAVSQTTSPSFIEANLHGLRFVTHIEIKGIGVSGWEGQRCVVQYRNTSNVWVTLRNFSSGMPSNALQTISISQHTASIRILATSGYYACCGTLRVFGSGGSPFYHHQPHFVLYDDVMGSSTILQTFENEYLFTILPPELKYRRYKLLFRASIHGFAASTFHSQCNNKGATITIVHSEKEHVFGGYTSLSWTSRQNYGNDPKAFLFLLRSQRGTSVPQKWNVKGTANAIYDHSSYGPAFGSGHDFYICNSCNTKQSYSNFGNAYGSSDQNILAGAYQFKVKDYEIWKVL